MKTKPVRNKRGSARARKAVPPECVCGMCDTHTSESTCGPIARGALKTRRLPRKCLCAERQSVPLGTLPDGSHAVVVRMDLPETTAWKLMEMGFGVGRLVRLVRRAPLGDPLEIELLGYRLAVRNQDVRGVWVRPVDGGCRR